MKLAGTILASCALLSGCASDSSQAAVTEGILSLEGRDLRERSFAGKDLSHVRLRYADLSRGNYQDAFLVGVDMAGVVALATDFRRADLSGCALNASELMAADLRLAKLARADLSQADLRGASLSGADLTGAKLDWVHLRGTKLDKSVGLTPAMADRAACWDTTTVWPENWVVEEVVRKCHLHE